MSLKVCGVLTVIAPSFVSVNVNHPSTLLARMTAAARSSILTRCAADSDASETWLRSQSGQLLAALETPFQISLALSDSDLEIGLLIFHSHYALRSTHHICPSGSGI